MRRVYGFFWLPIARLHGICLRRDRGFLKEFRGFPDMELGIFRVAKILRCAHKIKVKLTVRMSAELPGTAREYRQVGRRP